MLTNIFVLLVDKKITAIMGKYMINTVQYAVMRYIKKKARKSNGRSKISKREE